MNVTPNHLKLCAKVVVMLSVAFTLSSCNISLLPKMTIYPNFTPSILGFSVTIEEGTDGDDDTYLFTIFSHAVHFVSEAGSIGGVLTGYQVHYLDASGAPLRDGDGVLYSSDSVSLVIPPGLSCSDDAGAACSVNSPGVSYVETKSESHSNFFTLPIQVAQVVYFRDLVGARANVYLDVRTDLGDEVRLGPFQVAIGGPLTE